MNCLFEKSADGVRWECQRKECGVAFIAKAGQKTTPKRNCGAPPRTERCQHLGQPTGFVECPTCNGNVRLKVFACEIHGQCLSHARKTVGDIKRYATCAAYSPLKDTADLDGSAAG